MRGIELTPERPVDELVAMGRTAEETGFDTVFASSHYNNRDPFVVLDRVAAATDSIRVGPGVVNPYDTHPAALASRAATLQETSGGRAVFGVSAGDRSTLVNLGVERDRPLRRVLETVRVARALWAGERVDHEGTFVARDAGLNFEVAALPIYVGAQGPHMLRMAGKHADGVLVNAAHPDDVEWAVEQVDRGLADRPADRGAFDLTAYASTSVAADRDAAREAARPPVAFIAAGAAPTVLERHGLDPDRADRIGERIAAGAFREAFAAVTDAMIDAFCIAGTPEDVATGLAAVYEHADSVVAAAPLGPTPLAAVSRLAEAFDRATPE